MNLSATFEINGQEKVTLSIPIDDVSTVLDLVYTYRTDTDVVQSNGSASTARGKFFTPKKPVLHTNPVAGRRKIGKKYPHLTPELAIEAAKLIFLGSSPKDVARSLKCSPGALLHLRRGRSWVATTGAEPIHLRDLRDCFNHRYWNREQDGSLNTRGKDIIAAMAAHISIPRKDSHDTQGTEDGG